MIQSGGLDLQLLLFFSFAVPRPMWALVVLPQMHAPVAQGWADLLSPFSIEVSTEGRQELFEAG